MTGERIMTNGTNLTPETQLEGWYFNVNFSSIPSDKDFGESLTRVTRLGMTLGYPGTLVPRVGESVKLG